MTAPRILIVYATRYGQTGKVARFVADCLTRRGGDVTLLNANELPGHATLPHNQTPRSFDGVIVGGSIAFGRHQRSIARFVTTHRDALNTMPTAFMSISGSAADPGEPGRAPAHRAVDSFLRATGWTPGRIELVGGAIAYTHYNPLVRFMMKRISASEGRPTDTSRDYEFTDWEALGRFADAFAAMLPRMGTFETGVLQTSVFPATPQAVAPKPVPPAPGPLIGA